MSNSPVPPAEPTRRPGFFSGAGFPVFVIALLLVYLAFITATVVGEPGAGLWGSFVLDFRIWCYRYDPRTGFMEWATFAVMVAEPLTVGLVVAYVWRAPVLALRRNGGWSGVRRHAAGGLATGLLVIGGLFYAGRPAEPADDLPFPGARIRTDFDAPQFQLTDHRGASASLENHRGEVVLLTGVYALCTTACPQILQQIKQTLDALPPEISRQVQLFAVSLNPEYDTVQLMDGITQGHGFSYPQFQYLNGNPDTVRDVLDRFQFARMRNQATGQIEHSNLLVLIDRQGRVAYRLSLNPRQGPWLDAALRELVAEPAPPLTRTVS